MSYYLNADEIFRVGIEIERNGRDFYELAAQSAGAGPVGDLCRELAAWEERHVELFEQLQRRLPPEAREGAVFDPESEEAAYVRSTAEEHVFLRNRDVSALVAGCATPRDLLDLALSFERDSVAFYRAMQPLVGAHLGRSDLETLIEEELRHIGILTAQREKLPA